MNGNSRRESFFGGLFVVSETTAAWYGKPVRSLGRVLLKGDLTGSDHQSCGRITETPLLNSKSRKGGFKCVFRNGFALLW
jgi:hypothetical protein